MIKGLVNSVPANILLDTGAAATVLSKNMWDRSKNHDAQLRCVADRRLFSVQGTPLHLHGSASIQLELPPETFNITAVVADTPTADVILGRDFLRRQNCTIEMKDSNDILHIKSRSQSIALVQSQSPCISASLNVVCQEAIVVPPCSEIEMMARTPDSAMKCTWLVEGMPADRCAANVARALVKPEGNQVPVRLLNPREVEMSISKGTILAGLESISEDCTISAVGKESARKLTNEHQQTLWGMVEGAERSLGEEEKAQLFALLLEYYTLFATGDDDFGHTSKVQHRVDTGDAPPIRQSVRRMPQLRRQEAKKLLDDMLDRAVIQPSCSPWASPVVLVPKKDGSLRFCIDYRKVNSVTRKDAYPLPHVDDTLDTLAGSKWFSTLDLLSGYWQVEVNPYDHGKMAFCTHEGLFEFPVMPFGLCNAPATFQRLMDAVLAGLQWSS